MASTTIGSLQVLRGLAAGSVALHHTVRATTLLSDTRATDFSIGLGAAADHLAAGVDVFFVISGFIMVFIAAPFIDGRRTVWDFLAKRVIRVYPLYLVATCLLIAFQMMALALVSGARDVLSASRILASITLWPSFDEHGQVHPILGVGWTMSYEIFFYLVFCVSLMMARSRASLILCLIVLIGLANVAAKASGLHDTAPVVLLSDNVCYEFAIGCVIAFLYLSGSVIFRYPVALGLLTALVSVLLARFVPHVPAYRLIYWGVPAGLIVAWFLALERLTWPRLLMLLGDASYSIYVFHTLVLFLLVTPVLHRLNLLDHGDWLLLVTIVAVTMGLIAVCVLAYSKIEKPMQHWLTELYARSVRRRRLVGAEKGSI